jgi:hypothetical protein
MTRPRKHVLQCWFQANDPVRVDGVVITFITSICHRTASTLRTGDTAFGNPVIVEQDLTQVMRLSKLTSALTTKRDLGLAVKYSDAGQQTQQNYLRNSSAIQSDKAVLISSRLARLAVSPCRLKRHYRS